MEFRHAIKDGKLIEVDDENKLMWIELVNPTSDEINNIVDTYNLPNDYLFDVEDPYEVPRVERLTAEVPNLFILSYPIKESESSFYTRVVSIIIVDNIIISVRYGDSEVFSDFKESGLHKVKDEGDIENFVIELAWQISKTFIDYVIVLDNQIYSLEKTVKSSTRTESLYDMIEIQKSLIHFQMAIKENGPVIESIFELEKLSKSELQEGLLHDMLVENKQAMIMIDKSTAMLENLSNLYSNVINNNLNIVMKVLTSITIVMTVPTIISGMWGMNMQVPLTDSSKDFWYLTLFTIVVSLIIIYFLRKNDYL